MLWGKCTSYFIFQYWHFQPCIFLPPPWIPIHFHSAGFHCYLSKLATQEVQLIWIWKVSSLSGFLSTVKGFIYPGIPVLGIRLLLLCLIVPIITKERIPVLIYVYGILSGSDLYCYNTVFFYVIIHYSRKKFTIDGYCVWWMLQADHNKDKFIEFPLGRLLGSHIHQGFVKFHCYYSVYGMDVIPITMTFSNIMYRHTKLTSIWFIVKGVGTYIEYCSLIHMIDYITIL